VLLPHNLSRPTTSPVPLHCFTSPVLLLSPLSHVAAVKRGSGVLPGKEGWGGQGVRGGRGKGVVGKGEGRCGEGGRGEVTIVHV